MKLMLTRRSGANQCEAGPESVKAGGRVPKAMLVIVLGIGLSACDSRPSRSTTQDTDDPHAAAMADFKQRVDRYMAIHDEVERGSGAERQTTSPAEMETRREALRAGIRERRADAQPGDIFAPDVAAAFRQLLNPEVRGGTASSTRSAIREEGPGEFPLKPNAAYPEGASFATLPANVLAALPELPDHLEYRIIDTHLILRDVHANIVVDYMFDVMCAQC